MAVSARIAIIGEDQCFQVLFGDLPKTQTSFVWGGVTACRVRQLKGVSCAEFPERMDMLVLCILASALHTSSFVHALTEAREYFEKQGKEMNVGVLLASTTQLAPYSVARLMAYDPDSAACRALHDAGRLVPYVRGSPLRPLLESMLSKPSLASALEKDENRQDEDSTHSATTPQTNQQTNPQQPTQQPNTQYTNAITVPLAIVTLICLVGYVWCHYHHRYFLLNSFL